MVSSVLPSLGHQQEETDSAAAQGNKKNKVINCKTILLV